MELNWSLLASIIVFVFTWNILGRLLLRPLLQVLEERRRRTEGSFKNTEEYESKIVSLEDTYSEKLKVEKKVGFKLAEKVRNKALRKQQEKIHSAREQAESMLNQAKEEITNELEITKKKLRRDCESIARVISNRVLGVF